MLLSPARRPSAAPSIRDLSGGSRPHTSGSTAVAASSSASACGVPSSSSIAGYMLSSKFHVEASRSDVVADTMSLVSPERWSHAQRSTHDDVPWPGEPSLSSSQGAKQSFSSSYLKQYDYRRPNVTTVMSNRSTDHLAASSPPHDAVPANRTEAKIALTQQSFSTQRKAAECHRQLDLAASARRGGSSSARIRLLYDGLPYTWRQLVPFECPVRYPELMSYDPTGYHSVVARQTRDIGMRIVDFPTSSRSRAAEAVDLNMERGVVGASLRKHSMQHRIQSLNTYPGIVTPLA